MHPSAFFLRLPPAAALLVAASIFRLTSSHALPRPTRAVEARAPLAVHPWPTPPPGPYVDSPRPGGHLDLNLLLRRQYNTVCGYIGGDPALPATCSAGSHCAVDAEHGAIGCCPNGGPCTQGIFTGCVDHNSDPQTELNPYVYTCTGSDVCYKNVFDGGHFQFGCGSTSALGTTVAVTASGKSELRLSSLSVPLTETATSLRHPTTLGTQKHHQSTSGRETHHSASVKKTHHSTTESKTHTTKEKTTTATAATHKPTSAVAQSSTATATSTGADTAPDSAGSSSDSGPKKTGAIVGGTVGGVAALVALLAVGIWLWRRKRGNSRQGPGLNQDTEYMSPMADGGHSFEPLASGHDAAETGLPQTLPAAAHGESGGAMPFHPNYPYGYGPGSTIGGIAALRHSDPSSVDTDRIPLTEELDDFSRGFNTALDDIQDDDGSRPDANHGGMGAYPMPRSNGGTPLWQQNRRQSRNLMWM